MPRTLGRVAVSLLAGLLPAFAQTHTYTYAQLRDRFLADNPQLQAGRINIDESKAQEITAHLRPNPELSLLADQFEPFGANGYYRPFATLLNSTSVSYLHERQHKRELRTASAQQATAIARSNQEDLTRTLLFNLRNAFVQTLQNKAILALAQENLAYYDHVLDVSRERYKLGDIARVDLDRLELQRVQYQTDVQTAAVNLRTAKITLLALLNDRTPIDQFDVTGVFDYTDQILLLPELRQMALGTRPDLRAALETVTKARTDHRLAIANGTADPTIGVDFGRNPPLINYLGVSVNVPIRIFDKNQGEKARTALDIHRTERLEAAAEAQVFSDVDSAYSTINSNVALLRAYKSQYLQQATRVRDTVSFSYQNGAASLLDFLQAQQDYRTVQTAYLNLVGAYLNAASQLDLAVGREVIP